MQIVLTDLQMPGNNKQYIIIINHVNEERYEMHISPKHIKSTIVNNVNIQFPNKIGGSYQFERLFINGEPYELTYLAKRMTFNKQK